MSTWVIITVAELIAGLVGFVVGTQYADALTRAEDEEAEDERER